MSKLTYAVSLSCMNLGRLEEDVKTLESAGCDEIHIDVADGLFAPGYGFGWDHVEAVKRWTSLPCHVHLMVNDPIEAIAPFAEAGADSLSLQVEPLVHRHRILALVRDAGTSPGIALSPATPLTRLEYLWAMVDRVLVMGVEPGEAGGDIAQATFDRVRILNENVAYRGHPMLIEVQGGIDAENAALLERLGAGRVVLDAGPLPGPDLAEAFRAFKQAVERHRSVV